jgi:hypothetical protein
MRTFGFVAFFGGLAYLMSSWMLILKSNILISWWYVPGSSGFIFLAAIATAIGSVMIDCPVEKDKVGWFSGPCLLLSAVSVYYISTLRFLGSLFERLGAVQLTSAMAIGTVLCLAPAVRRLFFPIGIDHNYGLARGGFLITALSSSIVTLYGLVVHFSDFEFTVLSLISIANVGVVVAAFALRGWLVPAVAVALVIAECAFTGSFAIAAKALNVIFLTSVIAKLAYLTLSLRLDHKKVV